jgi:DNA-binding GntR family transcriptional regulator
LYTELYADNQIQNYRSERFIQTSQVPADVATLLNVKPGRPCIKTTITAYQGDRVFEHTLVWQLAEEFIFEFKMDLKD